MNGNLSLLLLRLFIPIICCLIVCSCVDNDEESVTDVVLPVKKEKKIAVLVTDESRERWERTLLWAADNIKRAQEGSDLQYEFKFDFMDEDATDLEVNSFVTKVLFDTSYVAMIGPETSEKAENIAQIFSNYEHQCQKDPIPLFLPIATSVDVQRKNVERDWLWCLSETNITQSEMLLSVVQLYLNRYSRYSLDVYFLCTDDSYGESFSIWLPFVAAEFAIPIKGCVTIPSSATKEVLDQIVEEKIDGRNSLANVIVICSGNPEISVQINPLLEEKFPDKVFIPIFSDAMSPNRMGSQNTKWSNGIVVGADPQYGFNVMYQAKYDERPFCGESQVYDALLLTWLSLCEQYYTRSKQSLTKSVEKITRQSSVNAKLNFTAQNLRQALANIKVGKNPDIAGASGPFVFDAKYGTIRKNSNYTYWQNVGGNIEEIISLSKEYGLGESSAINSLEWQIKHIVDDNPTEYVYPNVHQNWALLVAGSDSWSDYRHQADVLAMYWTLRRHGYDDDHIILIEEDNLADNIQNYYGGNVHNEVGGANLRENAHVDYYLNELNSSDIHNILLGIQTSRTPFVIDSDRDDNIFVFWCGHGNHDELLYGNKAVSASELDGWLTDLERNNRYRKLLFTIETCFSGSVAQACENHHGVLFITAANADETSLVDKTNYDEELRLYVSNGFSNTLIQTIDRRPDIGISELYYQLVLGTSGSHVSIYGSKSYGNIYQCDMSEFFK